MMTGNPKQKEASFKETKQKHQNIEEHVCCSSELDVSKDELANFVNNFSRGTWRYKGKLPLKCFNCGKIGHFAAKCPMRRNKSNSRIDISKIKFSDKKPFFLKLEMEYQTMNKMMNVLLNGEMKSFSLPRKTLILIKTNKEL